MNYGDTRLPESVWTWIFPEPNTGCWLWGRGVNSRGYGTISFGGRPGMVVHRFVYETLIQQCPKELVLDHLCRQPPCCNPDHLEPVTMRTNLLRGVGFSALNAAKTKCVNGHAFDEANTHITKQGRRSCRACHRIREAARRFRLAEAASLSHAGDS